MSENTATKPSLKSLVLALLALLASAIQTERSDKDAIAKQKAEGDKHAADLQAKIDELQAHLDDEAQDAAENADIRSAVSDALTQAQAARVPTDEQLANVVAIPPAAADPGAGTSTEPKA